MFGRRLNIVTIGGIKIGIDFSWVFIAILLTWTLAGGYFPFQFPHLSGETYWLMGALGMLGLFVCIVLHELGHAVVAKHYKLPVEQITLFLFGGVAEIKKEPKSPKVEFLMAIAGPIVSVVLAAGLYVLAQAGERLEWSVVAIGVISYLATINLIIVVFNMIPAFPLDGGRVFRALLWWWKKDFSWATKVAARLGSGFGFFLIFFGIFLLFITGNIVMGVWLMILGFFLQKAASSSLVQFQIGKELRGIKVSKFMTKDPISVPPDITIREFIDEYLYQSHHHLYPVTEKRTLIGYVSLREVKSLTPEEWVKTPVKKAMVPASSFRTISPDTSASQALALIQEANLPALFVVEDKRLIGILTAQDLFKLISLKLELESDTDL